MKQFLFFGLFLISFGSCSQTVLTKAAKNNDDKNHNEECNYCKLTCKEQLAYATQKISDYYNFGETANLDTASDVLSNILIKCDLERKAATMLKLDVFNLKKEYDEALIFLGQIDTSYCYHSYEYKFNVNFFKALKYRRENDKKLETENLFEARRTLLDFLKGNNCDNNAFYDYLLVEQLITNKDSVDAIIRTKIIECPEDSTILKAMLKTPDLWDQYK